MTFTSRQEQIVKLIAAGQDIGQIADTLGINPRTTKYHCAQIRVRLGVARTRDIPQAYMTTTGQSPYPKAGE